MNISEHEILIVSEIVLKQCYLYNNMDADCNNNNNNIYIAPVSSYLLNGACMNNFAKSNSDVIKSGVPSSMRACHKYIIEPLSTRVV